MEWASQNQKDNNNNNNDSSTIADLHQDLYSRKKTPAQG